MDEDDPEKRLAKLERERLLLTEQQRIFDMNRQPAAAEAAAAAAAHGFPTPPVDPRLAAAPQNSGGVLVGRTAAMRSSRWMYYAITLVVLPLTLSFAWTGSTSGVLAGMIVLTLLGIYAYQFSGTRKRFALLRWGEVAKILDTQILSRPFNVPGRGTSGTSGNYWSPVVHGWKVERPWSSLPDYKILIRYTVNGYQGELKVRVREYHDGVVLADPRNPARALCVTSFAYDLDRDESRNWIGRMGPRPMVRMAVWLIIVIAWLAMATVVGLAAVGVGFGA